MVTEYYRTLASRILYCDANCVVVNKIAGEAVEGAGKRMIDLPQLLARHLNSDTGANYPIPENALLLPTAVHRLDVPVSGCAVFARTGAALGFLTAAFRNNAVQKHYWAIVESSENIPDSVELVHYIEFDPKKNKSIAHNDPGNVRAPECRGRKKAILRCQSVGRGEHYRFLEIDLITGRHHQIRAQLQRLGIHIKGDLKYGARRSEPGGGIRLHARSISFPDCSNKDNIITICAEPPFRDNLWLAFESFLI